MRLLAHIEAHGLQCVPWKAPEHGSGQRGSKRWHFTTKDKRLVEWQSFVRQAATLAIQRRSIALGPVLVIMEFSKSTKDPAKMGRYWSIAVEWNEDAEQYTKKGVSQPDLTNLIKGTEDTLEGVCIGNDAQVCEITARRRYGQFDGVDIQIFEVGPDE